MNYLKTILNKKATPQSQPIPGTSQAKNSAGGYSWQVDDWMRFERFLILGSEGGSYYATQTALSIDNAKAVIRCIEEDGVRAVKTIAEISASGRAPKNDPAIFALALAASSLKLDARKAALAALPNVCRTGTHLLHFAQYVDGMRGWGRGLRESVANWYGDMPAEKLAYQAVKYQSRDGWSHRDMLRLAHPKPENESRKGIYHWITQGWPGVGSDPHPDSNLALIWAAERAKRATSALEIAGLIRDYRLPREAVPTQWLRESAVWEALLEDMPMTALIRNLATITRIGLISAGSEWTKRITATLVDPKRLASARIHPIAVLAALKTYESGRGERGKNVWTPVPAIVDALNSAFYVSFGNVESTGKRWLLALDVSGSMGFSQIAGIPGLTPRDASAAMALVTASTEPAYQAVGFTTGLTPLSISPRQRLDDAIKAVSNLPFGGTDCAQPMIWATQNKAEFDMFVVYTDNETWAGKVHPVQALREYRQKTGIGAKLVVVGMVANGFTIADPDDAGMLDVVGFDTATPQLIADFAR